MGLFHKYQGRSLQFMLEVLALLSSQERVTQEELEQLANRLGLEYPDQVLKPMADGGIVRLERGDCLRGEILQPFSLPLSRVEEEYLSWLLERPEAESFLSSEEIQQMKEGLGNVDSPLREIQRFYPEERVALPRRESLGVVLQAIRQGRMVEYAYQTRDDPRPKQASTIPWKVEYGAFDRRWWVIFYDPAQRRTIKARLDRLSHLRLGERADLSLEDVEAAMERLLEPEPVVLEVTPTRGALERCFLAFEDQMFIETRQESKEAFTLRFRWYRFDRSVILRRLLYLGPGVKLLGPTSLQKELLALVEQAQAGG